MRSWNTVLRIKEKRSNDLLLEKALFQQRQQGAPEDDSHGLECPPERLVSRHAMVRMCPLKALCGTVPSVAVLGTGRGLREVVRSSGCHPFEWISVNYQSAHV